MKTEEMISIRSIQHFLYCPHRWGLIEINRSWQENYFVVKANLLHSKVHEAKEYTSRAKKVYSSVNIWNDEVGIYGIADCLEERKDGLCIVEYKPKKPQNDDFNKEDAIQVFAQKICVDSIFDVNCNTELYYADVKKHIKLPFDTEYGTYMNLLDSILLEIRNHINNGTIPPVRKNQNCNGCSMLDLCMPKIKKANIRELMEEQVEK